MVLKFKSLNLDTLSYSILSFSLWLGGKKLCLSLYRYEQHLRYLSALTLNE
jgi:hypothetical protein